MFGIVLMGVMGSIIEAVRALCGGAAACTYGIFGGIFGTIGELAAGCVSVSSMIVNLVLKVLDTICFLL